MLTNSELENLEKKYFEIIAGVISHNIGRLINEINSQSRMPAYAAGNKTNPIETAAENIMNAMIARRLDWSVASMQAASDSCYECGDAIIHIDAKTILDTDGDSHFNSNKIDVRKNQTSFDANSIHVVTKRTGGRYNWQPKLHRYEKHQLFGKVPNLTYFLRTTYSTTNLVEEVSLICIPNGQFITTHRAIFGGVKSYPSSGNTLEHLRFKINVLTKIDPWREKVIYLRR